MQKQHAIVPGGFEPPSTDPKSVVIGRYTTELNGGVTRTNTERKCT